MKKELLLIGCLCCLVSCKDTSQENQPDPPIRVVQVTPARHLSERNYTFISQPFRTTELSFRVGGPVCTFNVQSGQFFRKGELIAAIDDRDFLLNQQRTKAIFQQAEADYKRISSLYQKGNISGMNYEQAKADYEKAKAEYQASVNALKDTRLYAPFDGYIHQVNIERYQDVKASSPIVTFIDLSKIKIEAYVTEEMAVNYRNKSEKSCRIQFNALPGKEFFPTETFISQNATDNNISYLFTAIIDNKDNSLLGGMAGYLSIPNFSSSSHSCTSLTIPQTAVCHNEEIGSFVWRVNNQSQVNKVPVVTGKLQDNNRIEILSGLSEGEKIAATRLSSLSDNDRITIQD